MGSSRLMVPLVSRQAGRRPSAHTAICLGIRTLPMFTIAVSGLESLALATLTTTSLIHGRTATSQEELAHPMSGTLREAARTVSRMMLRGAPPIRASVHCKMESGTPPTLAPLTPRA
jgi:hypothetical protein